MACDSVRSTTDCATGKTHLFPTNLNCNETIIDKFLNVALETPGPLDLIAARGEMFRKSRSKPASPAQAPMVPVDPTTSSIPHNVEEPVVVQPAISLPPAIPAPPTEASAAALGPPLAPLPGAGAWAGNDAVHAGPSSLGEPQNPGASFSHLGIPPAHSGAKRSPACSRSRRFRCPGCPPPAAHSCRCQRSVLGIGIHPQPRWIR